MPLEPGLRSPIVTVHPGPGSALACYSISPPKNGYRPTLERTLRSCTGQIVRGRQMARSARARVGIIIGDKFYSYVLFIIYGS